MANGAKTWSAIYQAAGDEQATNKLLSDTAKVYLMGVKDNEETYCYMQECKGDC